MTPLVSIIIPVYNAEKFLQECIRSAMDQTVENKEIIIVDDGSTDSSFTIAESFKNDIVKIIQQENSGASAARNNGLKAAQGEYIQFLDADDLLSSNKIEKQMEVLKPYPDHVAICNSIHFLTGEDLSTKSPSDESNFLKDSDDPADFLINLYGGNGCGWMVSPHAWLIPRSVIEKAGPWNESLSLDDDGEYFCRIALVSKGIKFVPGVYCYYRKYIRSKSLSATYTLKAMESAYNSLLLKEKHLAKNTDPRVRKAFALNYIQLAVKAYPRFFSIYKKSIRKHFEHGGDDQPAEMGGVLTKKLSVFLNWRIIRFFSYLKHSFISL